MEDCCEDKGGVGSITCVRDVDCLKGSSFFFPSRSSDDIAFATAVHDLFSKTCGSSNLKGCNFKDPEKARLQVRTEEK